MKAVIRWCAKLFLFWVGFFLLQQGIFLLFNTPKLSGIGGMEILAAFHHALPMDFSAAGYVILLPALMACVLMWYDRVWLRATINSFLILIVVVSALVNVVDLGLFQSWGTLMNRKALSYLIYPEEAGHAVAGAPWVVLLFLFILQCAIGIFFLRKLRLPERLESIVHWKGGIAAIVLLALLFIAARGGPQDDPINKSWSYYSRHPVLNLSAVNGLWNLFELAVEPAEFTENPYPYFDPAEAQRIVDKLNAPGSGPSQRLFTIERPNIVLLLLESWSGDVIAPLGGEPEVTPHFTELCNDGLLFTNFYSTGFRTEQGLCAIISGFPSQPKTTIVRKYGKFDRLPGLVNTLDSNGYNSRWYYTGSVVFANTRSYLESMGFDVIHSEEDLPGEQRTEWGAYDDELFEYYLDDAPSFRSPYFHAIMTATSHEPFDAPVDGGFPGKNYDQRYRNVTAYSDKCLGTFFDKARLLPDWDSTVYIVVADHGHFLPKGREHYDMERHRIACLLLGGALDPALAGTTHATHATHVDLPATVLGQLGLPHVRFIWSKDLFDPATSKFAFYTFDDGFGYADADQAVIYDAVSQRPIVWRDSADAQAINDRVVRNGKALLQMELERYMELDQ